MSQPGVALVTGAASGIGRQVALELGQKGWKLLAIDKNVQGLDSLNQDFGPARQVFRRAEADVTDAKQLSTKVAQLEAVAGPVDLLVACAGTAADTPALTMDATKIEQIIRLNLVGVSNSIAAVLPGMLSRRKGHLVAISSLASLRGLPYQMAYCASKAGLNAMMESLRLDVSGQGIDVTTICPGWTRTPQTAHRYAARELMDVKDVAREILRAIDRRARFYAFPRLLVWQIQLLKLLPTWAQDYLLLRRIRRLRKTNDYTRPTRKDPA